MDGQTLQQLFSGSNPFLAQMGEQAFKLDQTKKQADLATTLGMERRANEMQPYDIQVKQSNIRQNDAAAGYNNSLSAKINDELKVLAGVPMDERITAHVAKMKAGLAEDKLKAADSEMSQLLTAAAAAQANGGTLPLGYTLQNPQHAEYFKTPQGSEQAMKFAKAYFMNQPAELKAAENDRRDTVRAESVARIGANARIEAASKAAQRQQLKTPKTNVEAAYYYQRLAETADTPEEATQYMEKAQAAQKAHEAELVQRAILAAQQRMAGGIDMGAATGGQVQTNPLPGQPAPPRNPAPAASSNGWSVRVVPKQ